MNDKQAAIEYLNCDPLFHMDMLNPLRRGTAELLSATDQGVLLRETVSCGYFLSADTKSEALRLLDLIPSARLLSAHQDFILKEASERFDLTATMACRQAVWTRADPPKTVPSPLVIRPLSIAWAETISERYSHDIGPEYIKGRLSAGELFGAFQNDELMGFIGLHEEGSMGMLEVLPAFRRMGVGSQLIAYLCGRLLAQGLMPFSQFTTDNHSSKRLHEQLGFVITEKQIYWLEAQMTN